MAFTIVEIKESVLSKTELKDNLVSIDKNNINKIMEDCEIYR